MGYFEETERYIPLDLEVVLTGGCNDLEVISVFMKEIVFCEKLSPIRRSDDDFIHNIRPLIEVLVPWQSGEIIGNLF